MSFTGNDVIEFSDVEYKDGLAVVTFTIPQVLFNDFNNLFSSFSQIFKHSQIKARHKQVIENLQSKRFQEMRIQQYQAFEKNILKRYDKHIESGLSVREAIRSIKKEIPHTTCYQIELTCRAAGRFRKKRLQNV